jgi:hypothetical protein
MRQEHRIGSSPSDDLESEIVDRDPLLKHLERQGSGAGTEGFGARTARLAARLPMDTAIALDDRRDS